jgi:hypothetical protein
MKKPGNNSSKAGTVKVDDSIFTADVGIVLDALVPVNENVLPPITGAVVGAEVDVALVVPPVGLGSVERLMPPIAPPPSGTGTGDPKLNDIRSRYYVLQDKPVHNK